MIKLYNVAYIAMQGGHVVYGAVLIWAENIHEATGLGLQYVQEKHPTMYNHQVTVSEIDQSVIDRAYMESHTITIRLNKD